MQDSILKTFGVRGFRFGFSGARPTLSMDASPELGTNMIVDLMVEDYRGVVKPR